MRYHTMHKAATEVMGHFELHLSDPPSKLTTTLVTLRPYGHAPLGAVHQELPRAQLLSHSHESLAEEAATLQSGLAADLDPATAGSCWMLLLDPAAAQQQHNQAAQSAAIQLSTQAMRQYWTGAQEDYLRLLLSLHSREWSTIVSKFNVKFPNGNRSARGLQEHLKLIRKRERQEITPERQEIIPLVYATVPATNDEAGGVGGEAGDGQVTAIEGGGGGEAGDGQATATLKRGLEEGLTERILSAELFFFGTPSSERGISNKIRKIEEEAGIKATGHICNRMCVVERWIHNANRSVSPGHL